MDDVGHNDDQMTFDQMINDIIDDDEIRMDPAPDGLGMKVHVGELVSEELIDGTIGRVFIQFYTQCTVPNKPKKPDLGYTQDDVVWQTGVVMADVESDTNPPVYVGEVLAPAMFMDQYITEPSTKRKIMCLFDNMAERALPPEDWLAHVSSLYNDRIPGQAWILNERRVC